jgi:hypothetical protein
LEASYQLDERVVVPAEGRFIRASPSGGATSIGNTIRTDTRRGNGPAPDARVITMPNLGYDRVWSNLHKDLRVEVLRP